MNFPFFFDRLIIHIFFKLFHRVKVIPSLSLSHESDGVKKIIQTKIPFEFIIRPDCNICNAIFPFAITFFLSLSHSCSLLMMASSKHSVAKIQEAESKIETCFKRAKSTLREGPWCSHTSDNIQDACVLIKELLSYGNSVCTDNKETNMEIERLTAYVKLHGDLVPQVYQVAHFMLPLGASWKQMASEIFGISDGKIASQDAARVDNLANIREMCSFHSANNSKFTYEEYLGLIDIIPHTIGDKLEILMWMHKYIQQKLRN